jgi:acetylornithine deacetylase/succinyl-diaminopimelate desuccinylase-like protein
MPIARAAAPLVALWAVLVGAPVGAAEPDWNAVTAQAAALLSAYIRIDSANPPGPTRAAAAFLQDQLRDAGIGTQMLAPDAQKPILIGRHKGQGSAAGKPIVLLNHMDVVPADPARWSFPPFSGEIRDGVIHGRGALDMKGLAIAQLVALRLLAARGEATQHDLVFLAVPDEEVGGTMGGAWIAQQRPDLMEAMAVWDEGGIGVMDLLPAPALFISVTEKQVLWLRLVAEGRPVTARGRSPMRPPGAWCRRCTASSSRRRRRASRRLRATCSAGWAATSAVSRASPCAASAIRWCGCSPTACCSRSRGRRR